MNDSIDAQVFDFTKPGGLGGEESDHLSSWLATFCVGFVEKWNQITGESVEFRVDSCDVFTFANCKRRIPKQAVGAYLDLGSPSFRSLLMVSQPLSLALVCQLLGENLEELPAARYMTAVEETLFDVFLTHLVGCMSEAWPEKEPLECSVGPMENEPHRCRLLGPREIVLLCKTKLTICGEDCEMDWMIPHPDLEAMLSSAEETANQPLQQTQSAMEERVLQIPVDVSMRLGTCRLSVSALSSLQVGDVLVLDQPIDEPLPISVGDQQKFTGWLGRNNSKRAYKICGQLNGKDNHGRKS